MVTTIAELPNDTRDALRIVEAFTSALALAGCFSPAALRLAADYLARPDIGADDGAQPAVAAFVAYLETESGQ